MKIKMNLKMEIVRVRLAGVDEKNHAVKFMKDLNPLLHDDLVYLHQLNGL